MPSTPLAINRPDPLVPQWRTIPISTTGLLNPPVQFAANYALNPSSDVRGLYFTYMQSNGVAGAENISFRVTTDGGNYVGNNAAAADSTLYYVYLDENADTLIDNAARTGMKGDFEWEAHTMYAWVVHTSVVPAGSNL